MCLAVPGRVGAIHGEDLFRSGKVDFGGVRREVSLACVPEVRTGDFVLVHAGVAIARLDEAAARAIFDELDRLEEETGC